MPSRRMIHPSFWESETIAQLTRDQRLLFIGLISNADDQGRLRAHPALIRSDVYKFEDEPLDKIESDLKAIEQVGSIHLYCVDGKCYAQILNWWTYQRPKWAWPSDYPAPDGWTDRVRYRQGNRTVKDNWDGDDTDNGTGEELEQNDSEIVVESEPSHDETTLVSAPSDSGSTSDSTRTKTLPAPSAERAKARAPTGKNAIKAELEQYFVAITNVPPPAANTKAQKRQAGVRWWNPLLEIANWCDQDVDQAKALMRATVERMRKEGLTISTPGSIVNPARSVFAERETKKKAKAKAQAKDDPQREMFQQLEQLEASENGNQRTGTNPTMGNGQPQDTGDGTSRPRRAVSSYGRYRH